MHIRAIRGSFRRRVWHPCHTHAALRIPSTEPTPSLFAQVLPQNSRNSQKFLAENILPQISQIFTEVGGYGIPAIPTPPSEFLPQNPFQICLRKSSHGIHRIHRNFWWRIASHRCTQMVRLRRVLPRNSQNSQKLQAEDILPRISQIFTEVGGYGILAIPTPPSEFLP